MEKNGDYNDMVGHGGIGIGGGEGNDDMLSDDEIEFDHIFMKEFKEKRIQEMTKNLPIPGKGNTQPSAVSMLKSPEFGYCIDSGGDGWFIKEIEDEDSRVTIVVLFYEPDIPGCLTISNHLNEIAALWPHIKFVRIMSSYSGVQMNLRTLPIISTYKNGKLLTVIKNISNELLERSGTCTKEDVEWLLESSEGWQGE